MREVLLALNSLVSQGVIRQYALGGAIAASFYIDALQTEDVDAFVFLPEASGFLVSLTPLYTALMDLGGVMDREYIRFGNWPLQILTDANPLIAEAIEQAVRVDYDGVAARIFGAEYLCAIALHTGRAKDLLRVRMFLEQDKADRSKLKTLIATYHLEKQMEKVESLA